TRIRVHLSLFHDTAPTEIYTLSLHDALPISHVLDCAVGEGHRRADGDARTRVDGAGERGAGVARGVEAGDGAAGAVEDAAVGVRSEEHTSELQSRENLVCRLLLEKKKEKDRQ